jgi:hypothetical protein
MFIKIIINNKVILTTLIVSIKITIILKAKHTLKVTIINSYKKLIQDIIIRVINNKTYIRIENP